VIAIVVEVDVKNRLNEIFPRYSGQKEELIPILQEAQERFRYLPSEVMLEITQFLRIPENTVLGGEYLLLLFSYYRKSTRCR
jgi:NADH:ubiquinone oxidoreductase subunit E